LNQPTIQLSLVCMLMNISDENLSLKEAAI
jgi:hypothetical protein